MAESGFFKGWLGPFKLVRRYACRRLVPGIGEVGRVYEAQNVLTENPALVVIPGERAPMDPQEEWRVRLRSQALPPYVSMEVEQAPGSGRLYQLRGMLELLVAAIDGLVNQEEARAHLTRLPMGPLEILCFEARKLHEWLRARGWRPVVVCGLVLLLSMHVFIRFQEERDRDIPDVGNESPVYEATESRSPTMANEAAVGQEPIAYPLPARPFSDQARAPCKTEQDEVEINGGCWVELARRPPCRENQAEYGGKCYLPISAASRRKREPSAIHP